MAPNTEDEMSAYVVPREHIHAIVALAFLGPRGMPRARWSCGDYVRNDGLDPNGFGRMLWTENVKSVAARYPGDGPGDRPGPISDNIDLEAETYEAPEFSDLEPYRLDIVPAFKLLDGYEYQACEHDGWRTSKAHEWVEALRSWLIHRLPGYDEADTWEVVAPCHITVPRG